MLQKLLKMNNDYKCVPWGGKATWNSSCLVSWYSEWVWIIFIPIVAQFIHEKDIGGGGQDLIWWTRHSFSSPITSYHSPSPKRALKVGGGRGRNKTQQLIIKLPQANSEYHEIPWQPSNKGIWSMNKRFWQNFAFGGLDMFLHGLYNFTARLEHYSPWVRIRRL